MNIHGFADGERIARNVAKIARAVLVPIAVHRFPHGETNGIEIAPLLVKAITGKA